MHECGEYDVGEGANAVSLRLHCGIGFGDLHGFCVGALDLFSTRVFLFYMIIDAVDLEKI